MRSVRPAALLTAELTKIRTLRACVASLVLTVLVSAGLGALGGRSIRAAIASDSPLLLPDFTPERAGFVPIFYADLALLVFGVLLFSHEFTSGTIRQSLAAVPRRGVLYTGKLLTGALAAAAAALPAVVLGYLGTQVGLGPYRAALLPPPRALAGAVFYLVLTCLLSAGVAAAVRSPVAALAVVLPLFFVLPQVLTVLNPTGRLAGYLPGGAGTRMVATGPGAAHILDQAAAAGVLTLWTAVCVLVGAWVFHRVEV